MNTKMYYLYRDACNYKNTNSVILSGEITEEQIKKIIDCTDGGDFIPSAVGLDEERIGPWSEDDTYYFELTEDDFEPTEHDPTTHLTVDELVSAFERMAGKWDDFATVSDARELPTLEERDKILEKAWAEFADVPYDPETETIEDRFMFFSAGTKREEIWKWFDARYSKGVASLLYGDGVDRTGEISNLLFRKQLCFECDAEHCLFNPEGICTYPLVTGKVPDYLGFNGCTASVYVEHDEIGEEQPHSPIKGEDALEKEASRAVDMLNSIIEMLPKQPRSFDTADDPGFWSNGDLILCPSEYDCETVASFLEDVLREVSSVIIKTGYFDPFDDIRSGEQDDLTGFWYIDFE